jgi:hypothetical protein
MPPLICSCFASFFVYPHVEVSGSTQTSDKSRDLGIQKYTFHSSGDDALASIFLALV